jgi:hypothetical protein
MPAMETFTIREAAQRCEVSYQLMRKRVDRGTLQTVKRDGVRRVPRTELERVGLWPGSQPQLSDSLELVTLRQRLAAAEAKLAELTPLPAQLEAERLTREHIELALHEQRAVAVTSDAQRLEAERQRQTEEALRLEAERQREATAAAIEPLTEGNLLGSVRALLSLRRQSSDQPATPAAA